MPLCLSRITCHPLSRVCLPFSVRPSVAVSPPVCVCVCMCVCVCVCILLPVCLKQAYVKNSLKQISLFFFLQGLPSGSVVKNSPAMQETQV